MANVPIECPLCDRAGLVYWARVKTTGQLFLVCKTCEAVWLRPDDVGVGPAQDLCDYLQAAGIADDWWEIRVLSRAVRPA